MDESWINHRWLSTNGQRGLTKPVEQKIGRTVAEEMNQLESPHVYHYKSLKLYKKEETEIKTYCKMREVMIKLQDGYYSNVS